LADLALAFDPGEVPRLTAEIFSCHAWSIDASMSARRYRMAPSHARGNIPIAGARAENSCSERLARAAASARVR
jgi:hypothetical protein